MADEKLKMEQVALDDADRAKQKAWEALAGAYVEFKTHVAKEETANFTVFFRDNVPAAIKRAIERGDHDHAVQLTTYLRDYTNAKGEWSVAYDAATRAQS